ncbi:SDR family NAD(P)-dependent oxidoreductase [Streptomyces sp. NPDC059002]|uniref:SDR family NAD(P)-dependent oxidoreductase n=1 Tax=Streptomyces sp. NPDC059002 TaxID=3346690 RepID=UPI003684AADF
MTLSETEAEAEAEAEAEGAWVPDASLPRLAGRVVLVTGASGTIGAGIVRRFAQAGAAVVVHYRSGGARAAELVARVEGAGGAAVAVRADLAGAESGGGGESRESGEPGQSGEFGEPGQSGQSGQSGEFGEFGEPGQSGESSEGGEGGDLVEAECRRLVDAAFSWRGRLDALVNCAGIQPVRALPGMTAAEWRALSEANVTSAFCCTQAAARVMAGQDGGGSITHIASIEGSSPAPGHAHYSASKAALIMFARSAALEYGPLGIRVNSVSPGLVDRPGLAEDWPDGVARWGRAAPLGRLGRPEDIGNACVFLASDAASWISGVDLVVDGGVGARPSW